MAVGDVLGFGALGFQRLDAVRGKLVGEDFEFWQRISAQRDFDGLFLHRGLVGEAHAVGGQNAGVGVDEDGFHPQRIGDEAGVLAAGATEALQGEAADVVALLHRDLLDRVGHVGDGDLQEALGDLLAGSFRRRFPWRERRILL